MYKTILVPLENGPADETIVQHVLSLARFLKSRLVLVHVADGYVARNQEQLNLEDSQEIREDRDYLERRRAQFILAGLEVKTHLGLGDPAAEILATAEREGCELIAMATHGHGFIKDTILGSVASEVRHRTSIPVLLIRAQTGP